MKTSTELNEISLALSSYQAEAINPHKDKKGQNGTYADLSSVLDVSRTAVARHGLSFTQMPFTGEGTIGVETLLMHKSGQWISSRVEVPLEIARTKDGRPLMSPAQAAGSVITYLRRYSLTAILGLAQDDDDAATQASKVETAESWIEYKSTKQHEKQQEDQPAQPAPQKISPDDFDQMLTGMKKWMAEKEKTAQDVINRVTSQGKVLTDEQMMAIAEFEEELRRKAA
jgi:flagellar hook-basal body complex protein FliE